MLHSLGRLVLRNPARHCYFILLCLLLTARSLAFLHQSTHKQSQRQRTAFHVSPSTSKAARFTFTVSCPSSSPLFSSRAAATAPEKSHESISIPAGNDGIALTGARIAYLVVVHNQRTVEDAVHLFRAIRSPNNIIMVHVDTKLEWSVYLNSELYREIEFNSNGSNVIVGSVHDAQWSSWTMNDPTYWGMELATTRFRDQWDVFVNLSGDCMPVRTTDVMAKLFDPQHGPLRDTNFVTSSCCETGLLPTSTYQFPMDWHKRTHYGRPLIKYVDDEGDKQETALVVHWGSQWMALQPDFVEYLVESLKRPDSLPSQYKNELVETERLMTDETFIPTLLMQVYPFNETLPDVSDDGSLKALPSLKAMRYERMDENRASAFGEYPTNQRYQVPESSVADDPKVWGPYFLGVYDLANIKESGCLFVRKVSVFVDRNIVDMLPVQNANELPSIQWPDELKISESPDWGTLE